MREDEVDRHKLDETDAKMNEYLAKKLEDEDKKRKEREVKTEAQEEVHMTDDMGIETDQAKDPEVSSPPAKRVGVGPGEDGDGMEDQAEVDQPPELSSPRRSFASRPGADGSGEMQPNEEMQLNPLERALLKVETCDGDVDVSEVSSPPRVTEMA